MGESGALRDVLHNMLQDSDLTFRDFVEVALYHPRFGYYSRPGKGPGREGDFITAPLLSPLFSFALGRLVSEFLSRMGDAMCSIVDIGCGDGALIHALVEMTPPELRARARFAGVDRSADRMPPSGEIVFASDLASVPRGEAQLLLSNELFDAQPFARLVQRDEHLHELWVTERDGALAWSEHEAERRYEEYFAERGIELADGQFADVSLEWGALYDELCRFVSRGMIVTFDYGYPEAKLFSGRVRRFGTAAAYAHHQVSRDLLADPGEQDLTAHINFTDLERAGGRNGFATLLFERQARFLLSLGATEHPLLRPLDDAAIASPDDALALREAREDARRLVLPDGIGEEIRVLIQEKGTPDSRWSFQRKLF